MISEQDLNDAINAACSGDGRHAAMTFVSEMNEALESKIDEFVECTNANPCEITLIQQHPLAAFRIWANSKHAERITVYQFGINGYLDCSDAFRHALFNALNAIDVSKDLAKQFSDAHECGETNNDSQMDLFNNSVGHSIGESYPNVSIEVLIDRVCDKLEAGHLKISTGANTGDPDAPLINSHGCMCQ